MSQKLEHITRSYNSFVPDQVLTHTQLNQIIDYFEDQNRMTRLRLSGSGIACGLEMSINEGKLYLSQGTAITTDGDLVYNTFGEKEEGDLNGNILTDCNPLLFENWIYHDDTNSDYFANRLTGDVTERIIELVHDIDELPNTITPNAFDPTTFEDAGGNKLKDYVFLIYLECYGKEDEVCTSISCENQGKEESQTMRYLLIKKEDMQAIIDGSTENGIDYGPDDIFNEKRSYETLQDSLKKLQVKRLIFNNGGTVLPASTSAQVRQYYYNAINDGTTLTDLMSGFDTMWAKMGLDSYSAGIDFQLNTDLTSLPADIQYRFNFFKDLVETYNEARDLIMHIDTYCCPSTNAFPKHIMVGNFENGTSLEISNEFRHDFYESPVVGHQRDNYEKAFSILKRAQMLIDSYRSDGVPTELKITPSNLQGELGTKAIPFYYNLTQNLLDSWHFEKTSSRIQDTNLSYDTAILSSSDAIQNPLSYSIDENDFYRVEGHLGQDAETAKANIEGMIALYGLDFDVVIADTNSTVPNLTEFVEKSPSLTHLGGVPRGGTFVLATDGDVVFADFAIDSKLQKEIDVKGTGVGCCPMVECSFPWISSLKYLNNLSRSLNGTQSTVREMPEYYQLQIWEYEINGTSLKTRSGRADIIRIPLKDIFLRRMHAVTDAINKAYPQGLVFDFNESQKRMTITRPKNDNFRFAVRDISLQFSNGESQPKYLYTNTGFFKFESPFSTKTCIVRPDAMVCRDLREYNSAIYEYLHQKYAPVNKDDDNGSYKYLWEQLYSLRDSLVTNTVFTSRKQVRYVKKQTDLPYIEQEFLFKVLNDFDETARVIHERKYEQKRHDVYADGKITEQEFLELRQSAIFVTPSYKLDGDWVKGMWVDNYMLEVVAALEAQTVSTAPTEFTESTNFATKDASANLDPNSEPLTEATASLDSTAGTDTTNEETTATDQALTENTANTELTDATNSDTKLDTTTGATEFTGTTSKTDATFNAIDGSITKFTPEQQVQRFVQLKEQLLEDRGRTRMSIYLTNTEYDPLYQPVIDNYHNYADFYFCSAQTSIHAIPIKAIQPIDPNAGTIVYTEQVAVQTFFTKNDEGDTIVRDDGPTFSTDLTGTVRTSSNTDLTAK